jgi:hypothetical protein
VKVLLILNRCLGNAVHLRVIPVFQFVESREMTVEVANYDKKMDLYSSKYLKEQKHMKKLRNFSTMIDQRVKRTKSSQTNKQRKN